MNSINQYFDAHFNLTSYFLLQVQEWLCLNCQMQRALSASELTGPPMKSQTAANKIPPSADHQKIPVETSKKELLKSDKPPTPVTVQKEGFIPGSLLSAGTPADKATKGPESDTQARPTPDQKSGSQKSSDQPSQPVLKQTTVAPDTQQKAGSLFGSSGPVKGPDTSKTTESVTGKMFGFGSSIFSSASTLISSVQEESRTTPPGSRKMSAPAQVSPKMSALPKISPKGTPAVSPKMSPAREAKTITQKPEPEKKPEVFHPGKEDKSSSQPGKAAAVPQMPPNADKATCPLCKAELNISSKDPPNYNTCTECKTTVCNQCGFSTMPVSGVSK